MLDDPPETFGHGMEQPDLFIKEPSFLAVCRAIRVERLQSATRLAPDNDLGRQLAAGFPETGRLEFFFSRRDARAGFVRVAQGARDQIHDPLEVLLQTHQDVKEYDRVNPSRHCNPDMIARTDHVKVLNGAFCPSEDMRYWVTRHAMLFQ